MAGVSIVRRNCLLLFIFTIVFPLDSAAEVFTPMGNRALAATHGEVVVHSRDVHGNEIHATVKAFKSGTSEEVAGSGDADVKLELRAGAYDIEAYYDELLQSKWLRGISVSPGTRQELTVIFEFGTVNIHVLDPNGREHYSSVKAFKPGTDEEIAGHSSEHARLVLPVGTYDIEVYSMDLYTSSWLRGLQVADGATIERTVQFSGGTTPGDHTEVIEIKGDAGEEDDSEEPPVIGTAMLQMTGITSEDRIIKTTMLQMTGISPDERNVRTVMLQMTGVTPEDRIVKTPQLSMTGLSN
jgi:hypothetical protein